MIQSLIVNVIFRTKYIKAEVSVLSHNLYNYLPINFSNSNEIDTIRTRDCTTSSQQKQTKSENISQISCDF